MKPGEFDRKQMVILRNGIREKDETVIRVRKAIWEVMAKSPLLLTELGYFSQDPKHGCFGSQRGELIKLGLLNEDGTMDETTRFIVAACFSVKDDQVMLVSPYYNGAGITPKDPRNINYPATS